MKEKKKIRNYIIVEHGKSRYKLYFGTKKLRDEWYMHGQYHPPDEKPIVEKYHPLVKK